jgi:hypothetical protein
MVMVMMVMLVAGHTGGDLHLYLVRLERCGTSSYWGLIT